MIGLTAAMHGGRFSLACFTSGDVVRWLPLTVSVKSLVMGKRLHYSKLVRSYFVRSRRHCN